MKNSLFLVDFMKKALSLLLICVLLYQAGGFALKYILDNQFDSIQLEESETVLVKIPLALPYHTDWEAPKEVKGEVRSGDEFYQMTEQRLKNDTLYTTMVADRSARENFFDLANQVKEHLTDQPENGSPKSKLINTLVKEYCANSYAWVFYIIEWPIEKDKFNHSILSTSDFPSDSFLPPRQA